MDFRDRRERNDLLAYYRVSNSSCVDSLAHAINHIEEQEKRIEELESAQQWQPIETAPKDGTEVLVWCEHHGTAYLAIFENHFPNQGWFCADAYPDGWTELCVDPTHWMPLPEPPGGE